MRADHSKGLLQEPVVEKPSGTKQRTRGRKGKAYPKVDEGCFGKMDCILSLPRISFIALSKSSNVFFQGLQSHISIVLDVGLDFQYY